MRPSLCCLDTAACTPTGGSALTNTGSTSPIVVTGLTNGTVYSCSVKATNVAGDSTLSSTASSTPRTTPGSPTIGAATPSSTQVSVAFTAPGSNGGSTVTGYTMSCLPGSGSAITNTGSVSPIIVTGLTNGTAYDCSVTATNVAGTSSASSSVSVTPRTTPGAPTSVTTTAGNTQITVGFTAPVSTGGSSITGYTATCTPASGTAHSATGSSSPLVVTSLTNGTSYTCTAKATNAAGDSSSASGSARTPFTVPGSPTIGTTTPYAGQISVAFTAPVSTGGSSITAYTVSCDDGSNPAVTATGASSPILVSSLENGLAYACSVVATNAAGSSAASSVSSATPRTTPGAPTLDSLTAGNGQIEVAFTAPVADGGNTISGYTASCVSSGSPAVTSTGVSSPIMITGLTNGTSYTCSVAAANVVGASASSGTNSETPVSVPDAPALDSVTRGDGTLDVAFTAASDQGSAITGYTVTCDDGSSPQTGSDTGSPITVTGLTNGTSYDCSVVATNAVGDSNASSTQSGTPRTVPDAPSISGIQVSDAALAVSFADAAFDGGATVTGYTVTCDDGVNPAITTTGSTSPINVTGLTNGTQFTCTVLSTNEAGDSTSSAGDFGTPYTTPDAAGIDSITPGDHHLIVAYTDNGNGGAGITGHTVSCTDGSSTHTSTASSPATVTALTNGTSYTCSVVATNAAGDSSASATGTATPATIPGAPAVTGVSKSGANEVTVTFTAPSSNGGSAITGYTAYCVSATASTQSSSAGSVQPITVTGLESGNSYWCFVVATNSMGGSVTVTEP